MKPRALLLLCCTALGLLPAGCRQEHFSTEDAWWLSLLDQPQQGGRRHYCLSDRDPSRRARRGEATYCLTSYGDGEAVYRRDAAGTLIRGWRSLGTFEDARWHRSSRALPSAAITSSRAGRGLRAGRFGRMEWRW